MIDITFDRILSIGINYVGTQAELRGCINDVITLKANTKAKSRVVMTELSTDKTLIPTRANILAQIKKFVTDVKPGMNLLFQYSGHGSHQDDNNGDDTDGQDESICPLDYEKSGMIIDDELRAQLADTLPAGCTLWVLSDSCHSGTIMDLACKYQLVRDPTNAKKLMFRSKVSPKHKPTKAQVICFSGCLDSQYSSDAYINKTFQGACTWGLTTVMKSLQSDKIPLTYKNIMRNLLRVMKEKGYDQIPQISTGKPLDLDTVFATTGLAASRNLNPTNSSDNEAIDTSTNTEVEENADE